MLQHLSIQNFTIIKQLDLEFQMGMTVLTGETGAGKSILIDALLLALGERGDSKMIQAHCDRCTITASFNIKQLPDAQQWLAEHDLVVDDDCQLRRILTRDGRSRGYINGQVVPLQLLRELGGILISIHGQHEHQTLLKTDQQRILLDNYADHDALVKEIAQVYAVWRKTQEKFQTLTAESQQREARLELVQYQVKELAELALQENEVAELDKEHRQLANAENILASTQNAIHLLAEMEEGSIISSLGKVQNLLAGKNDLDAKLTNATELLNSAAIQLEEAVAELSNYSERIDLSAERLHWLEQRLSAIHEMARKHRVTPAELFGLQQRLSEELQTLLTSSTRLEQLQQEMDASIAKYKTIAQKLSKSREKTAKQLAAEIEKSIRQLGMPGGHFAITCETTATDQFSAHGLDRIEFQVSANPGQPLQPLAKVASGGELSRISLAIHVLTAQKDATATLIFDEVDVGIGGGTAEIVGRLLRKLGGAAQVLCVTHLPQVAALGHQHLQVGKTISADHTETEVRELNKDAKIKEIARMLGGIKITEQTLAHAREMVDYEH